MATKQSKTNSRFTPAIFVGSGTKKSAKNSQSKLTKLLGNKWAVLLTVLVLFGGAGSYLLFASHADSLPDRLSTNQSLSSGQQLVSQDGGVKLAMQSDGNLVLYNRNWKAIWSSGTAGRGSSFAVMQSDGNLVVYKVGGQYTWASRTVGKGGVTAVVQNDGNFVIYTANWQPVWSSGTAGQQGGIVPQCSSKLNTTGYVTDTMLYNHPNDAAGTQILASNRYTGVNGNNIPCQLTSKDGSHRLVLQDDGNLVLYNFAGKATWSSGTAGKPTEDLVLAVNDVATLWGGGTIYWSNPITAQTRDVNEHLIMQNDGNLVLYNGNWAPVWYTGTAGK